MPDARLVELEIRENLAGGPDNFELIISYFLLTQPGDVKRVTAGVITKDDIASEVAAFATANSLTWV